MPLLTMIFLALFTVLAVIPFGFAKDSAELSHGKALYEQHCTACHGADGKGNGPAASTLPKQPADFTNPKFWSGNVDKKIADTVRNGHGSMPPVKMNQADIKAVTDYMSHTFKK